MDIRQLRYFMAVAKAGSYSAAATELNVAQPTLSISVRNLEQELGVTLFYTFDRRQHLTDEGQRLMAGAQRLMEDYRRTIEEVQNTAGTAAGKLTVGLPPLIGTLYFAELIPEFARRYPNIHIQVMEQGSQTLDQMLLEGELDIALRLNTEKNADFETRRFVTKPVVALVSREHELAQRKKVSFADLKEERFAIFNQEFTLYWQIMDACRHMGFTPQIALLSSQWDFLMEVAAQNRAITILPKPIYDRQPDQRLRCLELADGPQTWDVMLAWNKRRYMSNACKLFLEHVQSRRPAE